MFLRSIRPSKSSSFFLLGARGTGKSTFLKKQWGNSHYLVDLLQDRWESRYRRNPDLLESDLKALKPRPRYVVIDEVQKCPKLLDIVHRLIESKGYTFVLTGSSARKLKRFEANLLAGRAFRYTMYPLTHSELNEKFDLQRALEWGTLPRIFSLVDDDKREYLNAYCQTYLKEEILQEQLVRNGGAFRSFLEVTAQLNGEPLNFTKISRDVNADPKTIQNFYQILEDTLLGTLLPAYHRSVRQSAKQQPKFYLFDLGIKRAIDGTIGFPIALRSSEYGRAFEHFMICEVIRLNEYSRRGYKIYHYQTTAGGEIDLILALGRKVLAAEIKSTDRIDLPEVRRLETVAEGVQADRVFYLSLDPTPSRIGKVQCLHWRDFLDALFKNELH